MFPVQKMLFHNDHVVFSVMDKVKKVNPECMTVMVKKRIQGNLSLIPASSTVNIFT